MHKKYSGFKIRNYKELNIKTIFHTFFFPMFQPRNFGFKQPTLTLPIAFTCIKDILVKVLKPTVHLTW